MTNEFTLECLEKNEATKDFDQEKIRIHFLGGLGDACLIRKYPVILENLNNIFEISSIGDIYEYEEFSDQSRIAGLLNVIKTVRLKGSLNEKVESEIVSGLSNGMIKYFSMDPIEPIISDEFLGNICKGDIFDVSVPNKFHITLAKQILEKTDANLIIEKPLSSSLEEILEFEDYFSNLDLRERVVSDAEHYSHYPNVREYFRYFDKYTERFGMVKGIELYILEKEDFSNQRNRDIIDIEKSGGGMWLDTGIHAIAFIRNLGGEIDYDNDVKANLLKMDDPTIKDSRYGETSIDANFYVTGDSFHNCNVNVLAGKDPRYQKKKLFVIHHENGRVELKMGDKSLRVYDSKGVVIEDKIFSRDAFYYVFTDLYDCISRGKESFTSINKAIKNVKDIFYIYERATPLKIF